MKIHCRVGEVDGGRVPHIMALNTGCRERRTLCGNTLTHSRYLPYSATYDVLEGSIDGKKACMHCTKAVIRIYKK